MGKRDRLSGNEAVAIALRQINPDVFPAFPITPSTEIPQYFASFVANGQVDTEFIPVESEHSSMSAAIGASAAGARALTATSSCGMAYMWEELYIAASAVSIGTGEPCTVRSDQHQLRSFRQYGRKRFRMDPDVCREQPGSIRQHGSGVPHF